MRIKDLSSLVIVVRVYSTLTFPDNRLHRALHALSPSESIVLALVLGAGLGSILHFVLILLVMVYRRVTGATSQGHLQLPENQVEVEVEGERLPAYEEGESTCPVDEKR